MDWNEIETENLILAKINDSHAQDIFDNFTEDLTRYMYPCPAKQIDQTLEFIHHSLIEMKKDETIQLVILNRTDRSFIGCIGLHKLTEATPEPGLWLRKEAHGKGYGFEAMEALIQWARKNLNKDCFIYPVDQRNMGSRRIAEKLGGVSHGKVSETRGMAGNELQIIEYRIPGE